MLIIVPTLAGIWPAVRSVVNRFDAAESSLSTKIDNDLQALNRRLFVAQNSERFQNDNQLTSAVGQISITLDKLQGEIQNVRMAKNYGEALPTAKLPHAWASAFFAALFAVLGHAMYQAFAPDTIRKSSIEQFVRDARDDYISHPDDRGLSRCPRLFHI
jgi:hypothetical protein